jgi:hypothetical protein
LNVEAGDALQVRKENSHLLLGNEAMRGGFERRDDALFELLQVVDVSLFVDMLR